MRDVRDDILEHYAAPGRFTRLHESEWASTDVTEVVDVVQGLLVYDLVADLF